MSKITAEHLHSLKVEFPYRWKVQTAKQWGCECVAYVDARQVMDLLDEVVGPENWQDHYREVAGKVYCDLSINVDGEWVTKSDCGTASNFEAEKGQASDAFKRAAVKWGVGRFLYALPVVKLDTVEAGKDNQGRPRYAPADKKGRRIYNIDAHISTIVPSGNQQIKNGVAKPDPKHAQEPAIEPKAAPPAQEPLERKPNGRATYTAGGEGAAPVVALASDDQREAILLAADTLWPKKTSQERFAKVKAELKSKAIEWEYLQAETADKYLANLKSRAEKAIKANADAVLAAGGQA